MKDPTTQSHAPHITNDSPPIRQGYKWTEVGVIPEDWEIQRLDAICSVYSGGTPSTARHDFYGGHIPWITSGDLNARRITEVSNYLTQAGFDSSAAKMVESGDIVVALYGATAGVVAVTEIEAAINQAVLSIRTNKCDSEYLFHHLASRRNQIVARYTQGGQPNLSGEIIRSLIIVIPPLVEQRAIAEVLSDVDGLLNALEALIAKKRAIKQATMQQLLTGRTRLPGFSGAWETKQIGDVVSLCSEKNNLGADIPVLTCSKHLGFVDSLSYFKNQVFSKDLSNYKIIRRGQIGYPINHVEEGSIGLQDLYDVALVSPIYVVCSPKKDINSFFLHRLLKLESYRQEFANATTSSINRRGSLRWPVFSKIHVTLPSISEQVAIAAVLNDVETEIAALEKRKDKTRAIKQGMMQQLLTGRVRLSESRICTDDTD